VISLPGSTEKLLSALPKGDTGPDNNIFNSRSISTGQITDT
jgi:hypothetical protein